MTAILKVDTIQDTSGNNIINESSDTITIGAAGDTVTVPGTEVKSNKLSPASGTALQIGDSGDTITIPSGATIVNSGTQTGFGGVNTPAFSAERSGAQSISDSTRTTIVFNNEFYDSSGAYDTSTGKFTPQTAGKYLVVSNVIMQSTAASNFAVGFTELYKNSSVITESVFDGRNGNDSRCHTASPSAVVDMNGSSDFILLQSYISVNSGDPEVSDMSTFSAFKIIE